MSAKKSPLEALIEFPKDGKGDARRELLRLNTDPLITAVDRYGARDKEFVDLMFSRVALLIDKRLRRCLAMAMTKSNVDKEYVKALLSGKDKAISLILRRSTTQTVPNLVNVIRERTTALYSAPRREGLDPDELADGGRFILPRLLVEETFRFTYFSQRQIVVEFAHEQLLDLLDRTAKRFRSRIVDESLSNVRTELLESRKEVGRRERHGELTEDYVSELLMTENTTEFILAISSLLNVDSASMQRILNDATWESLALACRAAKVGRPTFANFVNSMNRRKSDHANSMRIISLYNSIPEEAAERVMRFWQVRAAALTDAVQAGEIPQSNSNSVTGNQSHNFDAAERKVLFGTG